MDSASWLQVALSLEGWGHVVAWDAPGYGLSTPFPAKAPTDEDYAQRLEDVLRTLDIRKCIVVAHAWGALVAAAYAAGPGWRRTVGIAMISPFWGAEDITKPSDTVGNPDLILDSSAWIDQALLSENDEATRLWAKWCLARVRPSEYNQAKEMLRSSRLGRELHSSVAVMCGERDQVTPPELCARWAHSFGVQLNLIPDAGHGAPLEQPEFTAQLVMSASRRAMSGTPFA